MVSNLTEGGAQLGSGDGVVANSKQPSFFPLEFSKGLFNFSIQNRFPICRNTCFLYAGQADMLIRDIRF